VAKQPPAEELEGNNIPSCAIATDCPEWMESGVVAVSGHANGSVRLWSINYDNEQLMVRHKLQEPVHSCPITALRVTGDRQDTLLVGDKSGKMSASSTLKLDQLSTGELSTFLADMYC
jgi:WD40 repeat protein